MTTDANRPEESGQDHGQYWALFGPPPLFEGEDPKNYDQHLTKIRTAVGSTDILGEILVRDYVDLDFQVLRLRRVEANFIKVNTYKGLAETLTPLVGRPQAETIAEDWAAKKSGVVVEIDQILASANLSIDVVVAQTFSIKLNELERLEHLIALAETRRNATLREIERHQHALAQKLTRAAQEIEEIRLIDSTPKSLRTGAE
jgi:hypothetical protein